MVLDYGTFDRSNKTQIPYYATVISTSGPSNLRSITSVPEPGLGNLTFGVRVSQVIGGGSQVNGMTWDYPSVADIDAFEQLGNPGWGWEGLNPYMRKVSCVAPVTVQMRLVNTASFHIVCDIYSTESRG